MSGSMFASRKLTQSFATVQVGDYPDVRVYADNQHVATTDASGKAVIPRLRPFEKNALRIELADLPIDAEITTGEQVVRPYDRSGVAVDFAVQASRGAILSLVRDDGSAVPAGAFARLDGSDEEFVVAPGGEAYLTGLAATNTGTASWGGGSCTFGFDFPRDAEPQPRLGPVRCMENG